MINAFSLPAIAVCAVQIHRLRRATSGTTAESPRRWCLLAIIACTVTAVLRISCDDIRLGSGLQYFAAVMLLTPFVSVLGARQPGANAWPWFVVLPMTVVLQWPSLTELSAGNADSPIVVPTPTVIGFLFVLTMGAGNYFGTLNTTPMLAAAAGILFILSGVTEIVSNAPAWSFTAGCCCLAFSGLLIPGHFFVLHPHDSTDEVRHAALWKDFRDIYGIVWAKRLMDRINLFAQRESWSVEMTLDGFQQRDIGADEASVTPETPAEVPDRAVIVLCWLMKRFVDHDFLRRYLPERLVTADMKNS